MHQNLSPRRHPKKAGGNGNLPRRKIGPGVFGAYGAHFFKKSCKKSIPLKNDLAPKRCLRCTVFRQKMQISEVIGALGFWPGFRGFCKKWGWGLGWRSGVFGAKKHSRLVTKNFCKFLPLGFWGFWPSMRPTSHALEQHDISAHFLTSELTVQNFF